MSLDYREDSGETLPRAHALWGSTMHDPTPSLDTDPRRSALMRKVRQRDTDAEQRVRRLLASLGARYRINVGGLPGRPDVANRSRRKAVFVHGCFWHFHEACPRGRIPKRNRTFWKSKLHANRARDRLKTGELEQMGFDVLVVWECELDDTDRLKMKLERFWKA